MATNYDRKMEETLKRRVEEIEEQGRPGRASLKRKVGQVLDIIEEIASDAEAIDDRIVHTHADAAFDQLYEALVELSAP